MERTAYLIGCPVRLAKIGPFYLRSLLTKGILGYGLYRKIFTGIAHGCVFWGMALLFLGTVMATFERRLWAACF